MHQSLEDCFALMQTLVEYRQRPFITRIRALRHKYSMMHEDVLLLIYYFAETTGGHILEIGPYLGGSTIAAAWSTRDSHPERRIITIELGGQHNNPRLPSKNILRDLRKNLAKQRVADLIEIVEGRSRDQEIVAAVHERLPLRSVGLFIFDADSGIDRDLSLYGDLLVDSCWVVIDDYFGAKPGGKAERIKPRVDSLVASGQLQPLGLYGWGTWVGRYTVGCC